MGRYRKIDVRIWNDQKFNALSDDGKLEFFLLLTHPHLMPIGAMRGTLAGLASEIHWKSDRFKNAFEEILIRNMVKHDEIASFIWLPNFIKYNLPESPNVVRSWEQYLDYLPECSLKNELIRRAVEIVKRLSTTFWEALPDAFAKSMPNQEQEQEQEQEQKQEIKTLSGEPDGICENNISSFNKSSKNVLKNKEDASLKKQAIEVLDFLNKKCKKRFRASDNNLKLIINILKSGATVMDCRQVIVKKSRKWKGDVLRDEWLRPMTLFDSDNFEQYLGELVMPEEVNDTTA